MASTIESADPIYMLSYLSAALLRVSSDSDAKLFSLPNQDPRNWKEVTNTGKRGHLETRCLGRIQLLDKFHCFTSIETKQVALNTKVLGSGFVFWTKRD